MRGNQPLTQKEREKWQKVVRKELNGEKINRREEKLQAKGDGRFSTELLESPFLLREYHLVDEKEIMQEPTMQEESETWE